MRRGERRQILGRYVKWRLREECKVRGVAARIARETGFSTAHLTNVQKDERGVGEEFTEAVAKYWGMTYAQIDAEAARWAGTDEGRAAARLSGAPESTRAGAPIDNRAVAAGLAREDGVIEAAIASVLEEPASERTTLWWADRMRMRQLEMMRGEPPHPPTPPPASTRAVPDESGATKITRKTSRG